VKTPAPPAVEEIRRLRARLGERNAEVRELYAALLRLADGIRAGDPDDAEGALREASALLGRLGDRYSPEEAGE
jgi:hypothetical protein